MPQFDFYSFSEQVSLFIVVFTIFYFSFLKFYFSNFAKTIKIRLKLKNIFDNFNNKKNNSIFKNFSI
jgi:hypothetical protein